jgi:hypothetical protein
MADAMTDADGPDAPRYVITGGGTPTPEQLAAVTVALTPVAVAVETRIAGRPVAWHRGPGPACWSPSGTGGSWPCPTLPPDASRCADMATPTAPPTTTQDHGLPDLPDLGMAGQSQEEVADALDHEVARQVQGQGRRLAAAVALVFSILMHLAMGSFVFASGLIAPGWAVGLLIGVWIAGAWASGGSADPPWWSWSSRWPWPPSGGPRSPWATATSGWTA